MWPYFIWVPAVVVFYVWYAWLSNNYNQHPNWHTFSWLYISNLLPIWIFVAKYTKNIIFDALLYDALMFLVFYISLIFLGSADKFSVYQWIGAVLVVVGFVVMKLG
jgi:uncharacterized membrane protein